MDQSELIQLMTEREELYKFQARVYRREVDQTLLDTIKNLEVQSDSSDMPEALRVIQASAANTDDPLIDFAVDYASIFLGAGIAKGVAAYPYESVYTSRDRLVMQDAYEAVMKIYRANGIGKLDADLYEDHIALELEFMSILCRRAIELAESEDTQALEENLDLQKSFLRDHLLNWAGEFFDSIRSCPGSNFYKGFASFTEAFLRMEKEFFEL